MKKKIAVVIPAKNEEKGIAKTIQELPRGVDVFVVDGLSSDRTTEVAASLGAKIIHEKRRGYGRAYKTGLKKLPRSAKYVACLDADGTYPGKRIDEFVRLLEKENLDFISCQRIFNDRNMRGHHHFGNWVLTNTMNLLFNTDIKDSQTGMWVFKRGVLDKVMPQSDGMPFSEEFKILVKKSGLRFKEVPITYRTRLGEVKLRSFQDGGEDLMYLFKLRFDLWRKSL